MAREPSNFLFSFRLFYLVWHKSVHLWRICQSFHLILAYSSSKAGLHLALNCVRFSLNVVVNKFLSTWKPCPCSFNEFSRSPKILLFYVHGEAGHEVLPWVSNFELFLPMSYNHSFRPRAVQLLYPARQRPIKYFIGNPRTLIFLVQMAPLHTTALDSRVIHTLLQIP